MTEFAKENSGTLGIANTSEPFSAVSTTDFFLIQTNKFVCGSFNHLGVVNKVMHT
jgi:hypothetical protein